MGKKSTPKPPDLTSLSNAQLEISRDQLAQAREQMNMSQDQFNRFMDLSNQELTQSQKQYDTQMGLQQRALDQADTAAAVSKSVADKQISAMDQNMQFAQQDRDRYQNTFLPLQDQYIAEAKAYDTPQRRDQAAAQALADNQQQLEAQRTNLQANLASMGIDPSQVMSTSLSTQLGVGGAAAGAAAANAERLRVENTGRSLIENSINMGNGLPAQSQASYQNATQAGNSAAGATQGATSGYNAASGIGATAAGIRQNSLNTAAGLTGSPMAWASLGNQSFGGASNGIMNASSIQNQMFQNQMSAQNMKNQQSQSMMSGIGSIAAIAGMAMMAEGGAVDDTELQPIDWSSDQPLFSIPEQRPQVQDIRAAAPTVQRATPMTQDSQLGRSLVLGGQMLQAAGKQGQDAWASDPNMHKNWLQPVYRAEGGAMGTPQPPQGTPQQMSQVMPSMQSRDTIPAMLSPGEYVVPADVVRIKGQEFFDKLVQRHHRPGA